jgi:hypothetical protein
VTDEPNIPIDESTDPTGSVASDPDVRDEVAEVSADGTMGWVVSRLAVTRTETDDDGGQRKRSFVYAGIMTYEKSGGKWKKVANVSTFRP